MAQLPNRLQPDTSLSDNLALINDNADKTVQDIADLGAKFSDQTKIIAHISAGSFIIQPVTISNPELKPEYVSGKLQIVPRLEVFVDVDNDGAYRHPNGTSVTSGMKNADICSRNAIANYDLLASTVATYYVTVRNFDSSAHDYYIYSDVSYVQTPSTGNFR